MPGLPRKLECRAHTGLVDDCCRYLCLCLYVQSSSQLASNNYNAISTNSVSLEGKVDQMLKKVKAIKSDFYDLEADYKTAAHRQLSISLKPRGDKGPPGECALHAKRAVAAPQRRFLSERLSSCTVLGFRVESRFAKHMIF